MKKEYYTIPELAKAIGVTRQAIYQRVNKGHIKTVDFGSKAKLIPAKAFEEFIYYYKPKDNSA